MKGKERVLCKSDLLSYVNGLLCNSLWQLYGVFVSCELMMEREREEGE